MLLENLYSRFSSWHRHDTRSIRKEIKINYTLPISLNKTTETGDLTRTFDEQVQLLEVKTLPAANKRSRSRNCYSFNDAFAPTDDYDDYFEGALRAASTGDVFYLERCVDVLGVPIDAETEKGVTMLQCSLVNDHTTAKGRSVLHTAARYNALRCLKLLLTFFVSEEKKLCHTPGNECLSFLTLGDKYGDTPLHLACRQSNEQCVKVLIKVIATKRGWEAVKSALLSRNVYGQNPLHVACLWRCYRVVRFFITADFENSFSRALYSLSGRKGNVLHELAASHCSTFNECINDLNERRFTCGSSTDPVTACFDGKAANAGKCVKCEEVLQKIVDLLLTKCPDLINYRNINGLTPLMVAVINDADGVVTALLKRNIDIDEEDNECRTALHHAACRGVSRQITVLLAHGAAASHRDVQGATPLHFAAIQSFASSVRLLYRFNNFVDVCTPNGHSAFMWASMHGACASLRAMLEVNPMLDRRAKDKDGSTALHLAACYDQYDVIKLLVNFGWDVEARNLKQETPLLSAAAEGRTYGIAGLIDCNANVYAVDKKGSTVFHLMSTNDNHRECIREFVRLIPDTGLINSRDLYEDTPLFRAIKADATRCVQELLKYGAEVNVRDRRGWNALMLALKKENKAMVNNILNYFPDVNCFSAMDDCCALTLAIDWGNKDVIDHLNRLGAKSPYKIIEDAVRRIQKWYRKHLYLSKRVIYRSASLSGFIFNNEFMESDVLSGRFVIRRSG
uniref:ANK_REP_REGION domain-containing protein n=1 Tax=Syphacia muris TaxID=451379 RepID=A0A158R475_9BILA